MVQIKAKNISLAYENLSVIKNLSFEISKGDYLCIVGENGSGKSTLIKAILGIKDLKNGCITFNGGLSHKQIGYLPQQSIMLSDFPATVYEVVSSGTSGRHLFKTKEDKKTIEQNIKLLGLENIKSRSFSELSGGQKQRVLLARALCATKSLILLDEPTAALDPQAASELYSLIYEINRVHKITVIIISHDMHCIDYATHVLHLGREDIFATKDEYLKRGDTYA